MTAGTVASRIEAVRERIGAAARRAGRDPDGVRLIAVTKGFGIDSILESVAAGIADVGENRVQEAQAKLGGVPAGVRRHLIGHLQSNKAKIAAELFDSVHSIDSERIAAALDRHRGGGAEPMPALIELDFSGISGRTGVGEADAEDLARACGRLGGIRLEGLMTIAPPADTETARACFRRLVVLRDRLEQATGAALPELSMGMSDDFEIAVEEGATLVRLGRVLFGERRATPT